MKETKDGMETFYAESRLEWRKWLEKNHAKKESIWLIVYHMKSSTKSVYHDEAVEEALCFGWIDSKANKRDEESKYQFFTKRKAKSNWSKINQERAHSMIKQGLMAAAGQVMIDLAKKSGTWTALTDVQNNIMPDDLKVMFNKNKTALKNYEAFPPSSKRIILEWILNAKRPETRKNRIEETVKLAAQNIRANHYRQ